jgi:hypothetical protein
MQSIGRRKTKRQPLKAAHVQRNHLAAQQGEGGKPAACDATMALRPVMLA